jgi:hypothetical protein
VRPCARGETTDWRQQRAMRRGDGDNTSARHDEPPGSDQNERGHEYRRRLIAVEKLWRDAQVAILFGKASRKAAFATNDSGRYWRLSGARQSSSGALAITRGPESKMSAARSGGDWSEERNASSASGVSARALQPLRARVKAVKPKILLLIRCSLGAVGAASPTHKLDAGEQIRLAVCDKMSMEWKALSNVSGAKSYVWRRSSWTSKLEQAWFS